MVTVSASPRPAGMESSVNLETETDYLKIAKKGGGHKGKLSVSFNKKTRGQWNITFFPVEKIL